MYLPQSTVVDKLHSTTGFSDIHSHKAEITFVYKERIETRNQPQKIKGFTELEIESLLKTAQFDYVLIEADGSKGLPLKAPARHEPCIPKQAQLVIGVTSAELLFTTAEPGRIHRWETFSQLTKCCEGDQIDEAVIERLLTSTKGLFKQAPTNAARIWLINKMDLAINRQATEALAENLFNKIPELNEIWLTELNQKEPIYKKLSR
jgi:probable selenium-dependent hydroxylase accessory protein YqeC